MSTFTITLNIEYEQEPPDESVGFGGYLVIGKVTDKNGNKVSIPDSICEQLINDTAP